MRRRADAYAQLDIRCDGLVAMTRDSNQFDEAQWIIIRANIAVLKRAAIENGDWDKWEKSQQRGIGPRVASMVALLVLIVALALSVALHG